MAYFISVYHYHLKLIYQNLNDIHFIAFQVDFINDYDKNIISIDELKSNYNNFNYIKKMNSK